MIQEKDVFLDSFINHEKDEGSRKSNFLRKNNMSQFQFYDPSYEFMEV